MRRPTLHCIIFFLCVLLYVAGGTIGEDEGDGSRGWELVGRASPTAHHDLLFNIKQNGMETITKRLIEMSDPTSPEYGQHMRKEEVDGLTSNREGREATLNFLKRHGAQVMNDRGTYISATAMISTWESCLDTHFYAYRRKEGTDGNVIIRSQKVALPEDLQNHIDDIQNLYTFPIEFNSRPVSVTQYVNE